MTKNEHNKGKSYSQATKKLVSLRGVRAFNISRASRALLHLSSLNTIFCIIFHFLFNYLNNHGINEPQMAPHGANDTVNMKRKKCEALLC